MRQVSSVFVLVAGFGQSQASATPFEPATVPDHLAAVCHLDVDMCTR